MNKRFATLTTLSALALLVSLVPTATAEPPVVKIENAKEALIFYAAVETPMLTLKVTGPCGFEYQARSKKGEIAFRLTDEAFDGSYRFSVDAVPVIDDKIMEILKAARRTGDNGRVRELCRAGRLPTGPTSQSGSFQVVERRIVLDTTPESERGERDEAERSAELRPEPATANDELATDFRAPDADELPEALLLAAAAAPAVAPGNCRWAEIKPYSGRSDS